ncbi:hypothetical protein TNCV_4464281 [Trichonephila clavipes]|nr:hypothetical protein TNCV_4464281 [Trichonephila clavipes]
MVTIQIREINGECARNHRKHALRYATDKSASFSSVANPFSNGDTYCSQIPQRGIGSYALAFEYPLFYTPSELSNALEFQLINHNAAKMVQQPVRAKTYCAHPSIRDHWALRYMSRCPDNQSQGRTQCLSPQASLGTPLSTHCRRDERLSRP